MSDTLRGELLALAKELDETGTGDTDRGKGYYLACTTISDKLRALAAKYPETGAKAEEPGLLSELRSLVDFYSDAAEYIESWKVFTRIDQILRKYADRPTPESASAEQGGREGFYEKLWKDMCSLQRGSAIQVVNRVEQDAPPTPAQTKRYRYQCTNILCGITHEAKNYFKVFGTCHVCKSGQMRMVPDTAEPSREEGT
jgi:hypothetical protein